MSNRPRKPKLPPINHRTTRAPTPAKSYARGYRYEVVKPNDDPRARPRYKTFAAAQNAMRAEVQVFAALWQKLRIDDSYRACIQIMDRIGWLDEDGGKVVGVIDVASGQRYKAELVRLSP